MSARLERLFLGDFKSYRDQYLDISPVTLLVGRNGSGKSNALDALTLLSLLAEEREVRDLDRDDLEVAGLRGGVVRAAPFDCQFVHVGCRVSLGIDQFLDYRVRIDTEANEIVREILSDEQGRLLIDVTNDAVGDGITIAKVYTGRQPKKYSLLASKLAAVQLLGRLDVESTPRRVVVEACRRVLSVLRGIVVLDPVPSMMRTYRPIGAPLDRRGVNISSVVYSLRADRHAWERLHELVRALVEAQVDEIAFAEGKYPGDRLVDVLVALRERAGNREFMNDARVMSDGTLRYMAIVASLLHLQRSGGGRTLVVEEIENGLFPSQASRVLDLLRAEATEQGVQLLATTHSPALLDALRPTDHRGVVLCDRDPDGYSRLRTLTEHPRYLELAGGGAVGRAVTAGELSKREPSRVASVSELFD